MSQEYLTQCWNCLGEFDAAAAIWCSCNPRNPTKVCPFCLTCFCTASKEFKDQFWHSAPADLQDDLSTLGRAKLPIGELLIRANLLTTSQLLAALKEQKRRGGQVRVGEILVDMGFIARESLEYFLKHQQSVATFDLKRANVRRELVDKVGLELCLRKKILPIDLEIFRERPMLTLAMASPSDAATIDQVQTLTQAQVIPGMAPEDEIVAHLRALAAQGGAAPAPSLVPEPEEQGEDPMGFVQKFLANALKQGASDVQAEVRSTGFTGRYRIDGMQYKVQAPPQRQAEAIGQALYDLFKVRPKRKGVPVEAKATSRAGDASATLFLHATSSSEGEDFHIKVVPERGYVVPISGLGLEPAALQSLEEALCNDNGLFVLSAPPFHGIRSLLSALTQHLAAAGRQCVSLESPILVGLDGVRQIEFPGDGAALEKSLVHVRASLPQVVVLPEMIDRARTAAARDLAPLCLVVTAVRAKSACEAVGTLIRAGLPADLLAAHLRAVLNQRLVRMLCAHCRTPAETSARTLGLLGLSAEEASGARLHQANGCEQCRLQSGYRGRTALVELLRPTPAMRGRIAAGAQPAELLEAARAEGMRTLRDHGLEKLRAGVIGADEFQRGNF